VLNDVFVSDPPRLVGGRPQYIRTEENMTNVDKPVGLDLLT